MSARTLLRGGCVLTLGAKTPNLVEGDVLIDGGVVAEIGRGLRARDAEVVDAADTIVMPGFVDTHRHAWTTLFRHHGGSRAAGDAAAATYGRHCQPDDVYAATLLGLLGAVESGITTIVDWSDIQLGDDYAQAALQAHVDAGLRTVLVHVVPRWADGGADDGSALRRLISGLAAGAGGTAVHAGAATTVAFGHPDVGLADREQVTARWAAARDLGLRIHAHAGADQADRGAVAELAARGLLGPDVTLAQGAHLSEPDVDALRSHGAAVSIAPASMLAAGPGAPPLQQLIDRGVRPGLGVDDELSGPGDLFTQMRALQSLQRATVFEAKLAGKAGLPHLLGTREVIRYATVDGARVAGLGEVTGALEPGRQADIVVLRTDRPNIWPVNDPIGAVVWGMDPSNVDWVFVGGRALVRAGVLDADVEGARALALAARQRVDAAAGQLVDSADGSAR